MGWPDDASDHDIWRPLAEPDSEYEFGPVDICEYGCNWDMVIPWPAAPAPPPSWSTGC